MISIITPSFNQGKFIEETILSVSLAKKDLNSIEYLILDGGSTDETLQVISRYNEKIDYWVSEKDSGQVDAINKGIQLIRHDIFNWLNSDDYLFTGTLLALNTIAKNHPGFDIYAFLGAGSGVNGGIVAKFASWPNMDFELSLSQVPFGQESTFIRKSFLDKHSIGIDAKFNNIFDTVLYQHMLALNAKILFINMFGGVIRHHDNAKTTIGMPSSDIIYFKSFQKNIFSFRRRIWIRLSESRFRTLIRFFFKLPVFRKILSLIFDIPVSQYSVCDFIGNDLSIEQSWRVTQNN